MILRKIWPAVLSTYLNYYMGVFVVCLLPYVPAQDPLESDNLAQILVYIRDPAV